MTGVPSRAVTHDLENSWLTEGMDVGGGSGFHGLVVGGPMGWTICPAPSAAYGGLWGRSACVFTFGHSETELGAGAPTFPSVEAFGPNFGVQEVEEQRDPTSFTIRLARDRTRGGGAPSETTWWFLANESVVLGRIVEDSLERRKRAFATHTAGSMAKDATVRPARIYDVTLGLDELSGRESATGFAYDVWETGAVTDLRCLVDMLSVREPALAALPGSRELVLDRLRRLRRAPEAEQPPWAECPLDRAFDDAEEFVTAWPSVALQMPNVGLAEDGEVNFLWEGRGLHVDLGFYGDGTFSYFARDPGGLRYAGDDVAAVLGLPADLIAILKA